MYDFTKIKLVIWDLDETFWKGVLSESDVVPNEECISLVKRLTDIGIVNSICSKNDFSSVESKLKELGMWEYFVFSSIDWNPKGERIKNLISDMQLRDENVLFLDDNHSNLNEAVFFNPHLMIDGPESICALLIEANKSEKLDTGHKRLKQYKILEEKRQEKQNFSSNEEFLKNSHIIVDFGDDCLDHIDRIYDLVWRSNQLNFTKARFTHEQLEALFLDKSVCCGYVNVSDRFGDYGLVGFYALKDNQLLHFCFSCRILGMGIEQYVYNYLSRPKLNIVGEVISDLTSTEFSAWINSDERAVTNEPEETHPLFSKTRILIKGPCDLFQILPYIADKTSIDTELTYTSDKGVTIESTGHTTHIVEAMRLSDTDKKKLIDDTGFFDIGIYNNAIYTNNYSVVIISILADANLGVYKHKETGGYFAFLEGYHPLTDRNNWNAYINGDYNSNSVKFTLPMLEAFAEKFEFVGINTSEKIVENLRYIRSHLRSDCTLAVMLGGEMKYEKNVFPAYENRHIVHRDINNAIRAVADEIGLELIDVNKYLVDQSSFYDHFNHYIKPIYYSLAGDILEVIRKNSDLTLKETGKWKMLIIRVKEVLSPVYRKLRRLLNSGKYSE